MIRIRFQAYGDLAIGWVGLRLANDKAVTCTPPRQKDDVHEYEHFTFLLPSCFLHSKLEIPLHYGNLDTMRSLHSKSLDEKPRVIAQISPTPLTSDEAKAEETAVQKAAFDSKEGNVETGLENGEAQPRSLEEDTYAHGVKLATITVCVALSILLVALVSAPLIITKRSMPIH